MRDGQTQANVQLESLLPDGQLYALGALERLEGEVTVIGGRASLSRCEADGSIRTQTGSAVHAGAALLVTARVSEWRSVRLTADVADGELADRIAELARTEGVDTHRAFVFLIRGELADLSAHVVDGRHLPGGPSTHEQHQQAGQRIERPVARGVLLGFYSTRDEGVFTHHGERLHMHVLLEDPDLTAHVDHVALASGATISLPR
jgi:alpha-acetolactate decarboxylase